MSSYLRSVLLIGSRYASGTCYKSKSAEVGVFPVFHESERPFTSMIFGSWIGESPLSWTILRALAVLICVGSKNSGCGNTVAIFKLRTTCFGRFDKMATNTHEGLFHSIVTIPLVQVKMWLAWILGWGCMITRPWRFAVTIPMHGFAEISLPFRLPSLSVIGVH